jgi:hypothetical protein
MAYRGLKHEVEYEYEDAAAAAAAAPPVHQPLPIPVMNVNGLGDIYNWQDSTTGDFGGVYNKCLVIMRVYHIERLGKSGFQPVENQVTTR